MTLSEWPPPPALAAWRILPAYGSSLKMGCLEGGERCSRAVAALALAENGAPGSVLPAAAALRSRVTAALVKLRYERDLPAIRTVVVGGAIGGALGFVLAIVPAVVAHFFRLATAVNPADVVFVAIIVRISGLLYGSGVAFGIRAATAITRGTTARFARVWGAMIVGGPSAGLAFFVWALLDADGILTTILGGFLFGALQGLFMTLPGLFSNRPALALPGAAFGGALGLVLLGAFGFDPFLIGPGASVSLPVLVAAGAVQGLMLAGSIARAGHRYLA